MSYQPFLIADYSTGIDRQLQPWLLANDAFVDLFDGFVYRGITQNRNGYSGFATGLKSTYCESRMVVNVPSLAMTGVINSINRTYTAVLTAPVRRGTTVVTGTVPAQTLTDNGTGYFLFIGLNITGATNANPCEITTSVNHGYTTGDQVVISSVGGMTELNSILAYTITVTGLTTFTLDGIDSTAFTAYTSGGTVQKVAGTINYTTGAVSITFATAPTGGAVTVGYDYHPGNPVMGIMNFYPTDDERELVVVDTQYVNIYDPATDRLVYKAAASGAYTGDNQDFFSWVNYPSSTSVARLLFCNGASGDVIQQWDGTNVTDYAPTFTVNGNPGALNARQIFEVRDRLVLFQTYETDTTGPTTTFYPRRIRISGTGVNTDVFDTTATGAGFIDIPDNTFFYGAAFNRDDVMFFTEAACWMLKYTGNDVTPFALEKIDGSRGSKAAFSVISYLNRTMAASPRGLILSNGYTLERMDENIPEFTYNTINNEFFESCFSAFLDEERDVYMLYPSKNQDESNQRPSFLEDESSDQILVSNFEEDNFSIYRIPLSCLGNFVSADNLIWSDLTAEKGFPSWDSLAAKFSSWKAFPYSKGVPVTLGGGHKGEIFEMNVDEAEDNIQKVRGLTVIDDKTLQVTTDWNNYQIGDTIYLTGVGGMTQVNNKQYVIKSRTNFYTFQVEAETADFDAYTSGGEASRVIPFSALTKQFNPFVQLDKKMRVGWAYFYVNIAKTFLTDLEGNPERAFLNLDVYTNDNSFNASKPTFQYKIDCTNLENVTGSKAWVKIWINQTAQFLQFRMYNTQAGAEMKINAMMLGVQPLGRLV